LKFEPLFQWERMFEPEGPGLEALLEQELRTWEGTPYLAGQSLKGVAVDCVRFVVSVAAFLEGREVALERLPQDMALHQPESARAAMRDILRVFPLWHPVQGRVVQPGDFVVVGPAGGGPGHAMLCSGRRNLLIHSSQAAGVQYTGLLMDPKTTEVFAIYRSTQRFRWAEIS